MKLKCIFDVEKDEKLQQEYRQIFKKLQKKYGKDEYKSFPKYDNEEGKLFEDYKFQSKYAENIHTD